MFCINLKSEQGEFYVKKKTKTRQTVLTTMCERTQQQEKEVATLVHFWHGRILSLRLI